MTSSLSLVDTVSRDELAQACMKLQALIQEADTKAHNINEDIARYHDVFFSGITVGDDRLALFTI